MTTESEDGNRQGETTPEESAEHLSETWEAGSQRRSSVNTLIKTAGAWFGIGALLVVFGLVIHPPISPDPEVFMATIADDPTRWLLSHMAGAFGYSLWIVAGLLVLAARSPLTREWWTVSAWALLAVGSIWVMLAWLLEATVMIDVAVAGETAAFEQWQSLVHGLDIGFLAVGAGIAAIAVNEARADTRTTPTWAAWIGALAGVVAIITGALGFGLGIAVAGLGWLVSTIVMGVWALWFGIGLVRSDGDIWTDVVEQELHEKEAG